MNAMHVCFPKLPSTTLAPCFGCNNASHHNFIYHTPSQLNLQLSRKKYHVIRTSTAINGPPETAADEPDETPSIDIAFVNSRLLPDDSPDIQYRSSRGGQKLRDIMLDGNIDLYGPYDAPLSNCSGGGICGTCLVEVVEGEELLSPRTEKEKELLKKKPKSWRLACQTVVGDEDSRGQLIIQQLPEWKVHEWE